jgi:hypothetical protein
MDNQLSDLLQEMKALRADIGSTRTESAAHHLALTAQIGAMDERLSHIDLRIAAMEPHKVSGDKAAVSSVGELVRAALLGSS